MFIRLDRRFGLRIWATGTLLVCLISTACQPDSACYTTDIPPAKSDSRSDRREVAYAKEPIPPPPVDPCEAELQKAQTSFSSAYQRAQNPRITILANILSGEAAATPSRPKETPRLSPTADSPDHPDATPVDRAAAENQFIELFQSVDRSVHIIDLGVVRGQFDRAKAEGSNKQIDVLKKNDLADIAIFLELRVNGSHEPLALEVRAVRVSDGVILAVASPTRMHEASGHKRSELYRLCFCGAAEIAQKLASAMEGGTR